MVSRDLEDAGLGIVRTDGYDGCGERARVDCLEDCPQVGAASGPEDGQSERMVSLGLGAHYSIEARGFRASGSTVFVGIYRLSRTLFHSSRWADSSAKSASVESRTSTDLMVSPCWMEFTIS